MKVQLFPALVALLLLALAPASAAAESPEKVLDASVKLSEALAADDLEATQKAATALATAAKPWHPDLAEKAAAVATSDSLEKARENFRPVSELSIELAQGQEGYFVMTCPMAKGDWLQKEKEVANPYYGASMLRCGGLKKL